MESTGHVSVPLRTGKKMKKRKELDALVANSVTKRSCVKRGQAGCGISSQDQLLSESTDDQEYWIAGRAKRPRARLSRRRACGNVFRACSAVLMFACVVATATVLWLFIDIREQITQLRSELDRVVSSSQTVPQELQRLHTKSKSLQQNQTLITNQIDTLKLQLENFTKDVSDIQNTLNKIQEKLHSIPEHVNVPQQLQDVSASIANLGSQIKDITTTVATLKSAKEELEVNNNALVQNVTSLRQSITSLQNMSQVPVVPNNEDNIEIQNMQKAIDGIKNNITTINSTLSNNIIWIREDLKKNNKNIESISNVGQNMSARVTTLEGICGKTSSDQINLSTNLKGISDQLQSISLNVQNHSSQISDLQSKIFQLNQNNSEIVSSISLISHYLDSSSNKDFTQPQELNTGTTKTENPSSTVIQETVSPTAPTKRNPTGKPNVLT